MPVRKRRLYEGDKYAFSVGMESDENFFSMFGNLSIGWDFDSNDYTHPFAYNTFWSYTKIASVN